MNHKSLISSFSVIGGEIKENGAFARGKRVSVQLEPNLHLCSKGADIVHTWSRHCSLFADGRLAVLSRCAYLGHLLCIKIFPKTHSPQSGGVKFHDNIKQMPTKIQLLLFCIVHVLKSLHTNFGNVYGRHLDLREINESAAVVDSNYEW